MLVLSRRVGEKIVIGNEIIIEVLAVGSDGLRLGITAPRDTSVHRYEVFVEIQETNAAASAASAALPHSALANLAAQLRTREDAIKTVLPSPEARSGKVASPSQGT